MGSQGQHRSSFAAGGLAPSSLYTPSNMLWGPPLVNPSSTCNVERQAGRGLYRPRLTDSSTTCQIVHSVAEKQSLGVKLKEAAWKAAGGGLAGGAAMGINVCTLMWMRTTVNYQYRYGTSTTQAFKALYNDGGRGLGGIARFYRGLGPALLQAPLSRFGDTAANVGMLALWDSFESTKDIPVAAKTISASAAAASVRVFLMPIDAFKTMMQVEGKGAAGKLMEKARASGLGVFWHGAMGAVSATFVGHYPWFFTYNILNEYLPQYDRNIDLPRYLLRSAAIGFCSSAVSDTCSNAIRVLKTGKQSSTVPITYMEVYRGVVAKDGYRGLFLRGLGTKIISNGAQGMLFNVFWRLGQDWLESRKEMQEHGEKRAAVRGQEALSA